MFQSMPKCPISTLGGVLCLACLVIAAPAAAAPENEDPVAGFLVKRGLIGGGDNVLPGSGLASHLLEQTQAASDWASDLVISAMNFLGVRYQMGGDSVAHGFDCSGFTRHVFESSVGLVLPRRSQEQAQSNALTPVARGELRPGDLVFFNTLRAAFSHVGIYIGDGKFIHSPRTGSEVRIEDMQQPYWQTRYDGARRATPPRAAASVPPMVSATSAPR